MQALVHKAFPAIHRSVVPPLRAVAGGGDRTLPRLSWRWLVQIRLGDEAARQAFLEAWGPVIDQEVHRYTRKGGDPEELAAEANLALWEGAMAYDPHRHRTTPERYIANRLHKRIRRSYLEQTGYDRSARETPLDLVDAPAVTEERYAAVEQRIDLAEAVGGLAPRDQSLFRRYLLLAEGGHGPDEAARLVAQQAGGSFGAWKKRLERVRRKVRKSLE